MINENPMYLVHTSNKKIADMYQATRGTSLVTGNVVLTGLLLNIHENGLVTSTEGKTLFKMSNIKNIKELQGAICITTENSIYHFMDAA